MSIERVTWKTLDGEVKVTETKTKVRPTLCTQIVLDWSGTILKVERKEGEEWVVIGKESVDA